MSAFTDKSHNKIGDHTGDTTSFFIFFFPFAFSVPSPDNFDSLSLWVIHSDSLGLEILLDFMSFSQFFKIYRDRRIVPC
jgi:hypothetical protein